MSGPPPAAPRAAARTSAATRAWRLLRVVVHVLWGCAISALVFPWIDNRRQLRIIRNWSKGMLTALGVKVTVHGHRPSTRVPILLVANHVSWLDVWLVLSVYPVRFVAKSDIRGWPLVGWLVARAGTVFIERTRRHDAARINQHIAEVMARPEAVGIFPEGTTTDGTQLRAFHASLFQPALAPGVRVAVTSIRYPLADGSPNVDAAYSGDRSLLQSLRLILAQRVLRAELSFLGVIDPAGKTRRELAQESHALIARSLEPWIRHSPHGTTADPPGAAQ